MWGIRDEIWRYLIRKPELTVDLLKIGTVWSGYFTAAGCWSSKEYFFVSPSNVEKVCSPYRISVSWLNNAKHYFGGGLDSCFCLNLYDKSWQKTERDLIGTRFFSYPCFYTQLLPSEPLKHNRNSMSFGALGIDPTVINNNSLPVCTFSDVCPSRGAEGCQSWFWTPCLYTRDRALEWNAHVTNKARICRKGDSLWLAEPPRKRYIFRSFQSLERQRTFTLEVCA